MTAETARVLALVAVPVLATGAWLAADIIADRKERRRAEEVFDSHVRELAARRAAPATGNRDNGRA